MARHLPFANATAIDLPLSGVLKDRNAHEAASSLRINIIKSVLPPVWRKDEDRAPQKITKGTQSSTRANVTAELKDEM